jgi:MFS family permease
LDTFSLAGLPILWDGGGCVGRRIITVSSWTLNSLLDGYELAIITIATFTQALAGSAPGLNLIAVLAFWRFLMGVGVGGDYPLSAVLTAEFASTRIRG